MLYLNIFKMNHPMVTISNNKLLLQLNLSNAIQFDQTQQYQKNRDLSKFLNEERQNAYTILNNVIFNQKKDSIQTALIEFSNDYQNGNFKLDKQYKLEEIGLVAKFDESVLFKILSSIQNVDSKINQLRNGQRYDAPTEEEIKETAQNYQIQAKQQLQKNMPQKINVLIQEFYKQDDENFSNYNPNVTYQQTNNNNEPYRLKETEQNLRCAYNNHNQPIIMVILDPNKNQKERLLCNLCVQNLETNEKTIGFSKAYQMIQEYHQESCKLRKRVVNDNIQQLEQLKSNIIELKSYINQQLDQMIEITKNWISNLSTHINEKVEGSFSKGLDLLIKNELRVDNDKIVEEINNLNNQWIEKVKNKLEQFKQFKQSSECEKVFNDLKNKCNSDRYAIIDLKSNKIFPLKPQQIRGLIN